MYVVICVSHMQQDRLKGLTICLCSLYTEQSINYFGQQRAFFQIYMFQPLKCFFLDI